MRRILVVAATAILLCLTTLAAHAAVWPMRAVNVTVPFSQGNAIDLLVNLQARVFAAQNAQTLQSTYIPGRGGLNAWAMIDDSNTNGNVLTAVELPGLALRSMQPYSGLELYSIVICHVSAYSPLALWVSQDSPIRSLDDFIAEAKKQPRKVQVAGPGTYSPAQIAALRFDRQSGIQTIYMPFMGETEAAAATQSQDIKAFWADALHYPSFNGAFRPIAIAAEVRSSVFPELPTFRELGYELVEGSFRGYVVPAGTPLPLLQAIYETFEAVRTDKRFTDAAVALGFGIPAMGQDGFGRFMSDLTTEYREKAENLDIVLSPPGALPETPPAAKVPHAQETAEPHPHI